MSIQVAQPRVLTCCPTGPLMMVPGTALYTLLKNTNAVWIRIFDRQTVTLTVYWDGAVEMRVTAKSTKRSFHPDQGTYRGKRAHRVWNKRENRKKQNGTCISYRKFGLNLKPECRQNLVSQRTAWTEKRKTGQIQQGCLTWSCRLKVQWIGVVRNFCGELWASNVTKL